MTSARIRNIADRLAIAWRERAITLKAISFGLVGLINTIVDFGVWYLATEFFRSSVKLTNLLGTIVEICHCSSTDKLALIPANIIAWSVAVSGSYVLNSLITFSAESGGRLRAKAYASFAVSGIAGLIANTTAVYVLSSFIPEVAAKVCAILASFAVNFSLSHFVVFRRRRDAS